MKLFELFVLGLLAVGVSSEGRDTCAGRCNQSPDSNKACQCNRPCLRFGDCCDDYIDLCLQPRPTCENRCNTAHDASQPCQCNAECSARRNCCHDYVRLCGGHSDVASELEPGVCVKTPVSNDEISEVSLELWRLDENRARPGDIEVNPQSQTDDGANIDLSSKPFFTYVNEDVFQRPTFQSLISLLDNYERHQGRHEDFTDQEFGEINRFLDLVLSTSVGQRLYRFLDSKGLAGCGDLETFKDQLYKIWFQMYSRMHGATDSSGFEHVFVGEIKRGKVSGFHNWVQLYLLEKQHKLDYYGFVRRGKPEIYGANFNWEGYVKPLGGVMVGSSPELEFALITLCHMTRPGSKCYVTLDDRSGSLVTVPIQTWTWSRDNPGNGLKYLSSGYFVV